MVSEQRRERGQGFSHSGLWSNALKALCFYRIVRQDTASLTGPCCLEHNDWLVEYFFNAAWVIKSVDTVQKNQYEFSDIKHYHCHTVCARVQAKGESENQGEDKET